MILWHCTHTGQHLLNASEGEQPIFPSRRWDDPPVSDPLCPARWYWHTCEYTVTEIDGVDPSEKVGTAPRKGPSLVRLL